MRTPTPEAVLSAYIASIGNDVYIDLPDGSYNSFGGRESGYGIGR